MRAVKDQRHYRYIFGLPACRLRTQRTTPRSDAHRRALKPRNSSAPHIAERAQNTRSSAFMTSLPRLTVRSVDHTSVYFRHCILSAIHLSPASRPSSRTDVWGNTCHSIPFAPIHGSCSRNSSRTTLIVLQSHLCRVLPRDVSTQPVSFGLKRVKNWN